jgi:hypothetical protein
MLCEYDGTGLPWFPKGFFGLFVGGFFSLGWRPDWHRTEAYAQFGDIFQSSASVVVGFHPGAVLGDKHNLGFSFTSTSGRDAKLRGDGLDRELSRGGTFPMDGSQRRSFSLKPDR